MKISVIGDINIHYIESLCQLFFGAVKFSNSVSDDGTPDVFLELYESDSKVQVICRFMKSGLTNSFEYIHKKDERLSDLENRKLAAGNAFYKAGVAYTSKKLPWGILTGIRPSKLVLEYMNRGFSEKDIFELLENDYRVFHSNAVLAIQIAKTEKKYLCFASDHSASIYISIPFCPTKCAYCSFVSCASKKLFSLINPYIERLCSDIQKTSHLISELGLTVRSLYIGGGTPSILNSSQIKTLMAAIRQYLPLEQITEFSFEAGRPDTITAEKIKILCESGVTRISVNPQSLSDKVLKTVGREHTAEDFYKAYDIVASSGIPCINTDLIAGLPGDSVEQFQSTVDQIIKLHPQNVTIHSFCIKNAAALRQNANEFLSKTTVAENSVSYSKEALSLAKYTPYYIYRQKNTIGNLENVGWCMEGFESAYNILMMEEMHTIFGIGAGAVTKLVSADREHIERIFNPKYPYEYLGLSSKKLHNENIDIDTEVKNFYNKYYF